MSCADANLARALFDYEPITGALRWKVNRYAGEHGGRLVARAGDIAGCKCPRHGYWKVNFKGRSRPAHKVIWLIVTGEWPSALIDHRDTVKANNRWDNLRAATQAQNGQNRGANKRNKHGLKGVTYWPARKKYMAQIMANGVKKTLGYFETPNEAHAAYCAAAANMHGQFANFGEKS
jgi:hypothetical protein